MNNVENNEQQKTRIDSIFKEIDLLFIKHRCRNDEVVLLISGVVTKLLMSQSMTNEPVKPSDIFRMVRDNVKGIFERNFN